MTTAEPEQGPVPQTMKLLLKGFQWQPKGTDYYLGEGAYSADSLMTREQTESLYRWLVGYGLIDRFGAPQGSRKDFSMGVAFAQMTQTPEGEVKDHKMLANVGMDRVYLTLSKTAFEQLQTELPKLFQMKEQGKGR